MCFLVVLFFLSSICICAYISIDSGLVYMIEFKYIVIIVIVISIIMLISGIIESIEKGNADIVVRYIEKKSKEEIINSRFKLYIISEILYRATPFYKSDGVITKTEEMKKVFEKYKEKIDIDVYEFIDEYRRCFDVRKVSDEIEEKIKLRIWTDLIHFVLITDFEINKHILEVIEIEKFKKYLRNHKKIEVSIFLGY